MALLLLLLLFRQTSPFLLTTSVVSDPPDSVQDISTSITFTCVVDEHINQTESVEYQWFRWCSATNEYLLLPEETDYKLNVSIPQLLTCWNGIQCNVTDNDGNNGSEFVTLPSRTGVGLVVEGSLVLNNSMVMTSDAESFGNLYCLTAADNVAAYWITPDGSHLNQSTTIYNIELSNENSTFQYIMMSVNNGSMYIEGLYQCVIHDENQEYQTLYVWIYPEEFEVYGLPFNKSSTPTLINHYAFSTGILQLLCVFQGAAGTINWYLNESPILNTNNNYSIEHHIANHTLIVFVGVLLNENMVPLELIGDYRCEFVTNTISEINGWKAESSSVSFYFIVQPIGQHYPIECPIPIEHNATVWVTKDDEIFITPRLSNGTALIINFSPIKDTDYKAMFACHSENSIDTLMFTIICIEPATEILSVSFDPPLLPTSGDSFTLRCTVVKLNMGFTGTPEIHWLRNSGFVGLDVMMSDHNQTTSSTLSIEYLKTSASGRYTCISFLYTHIPDIDIIRSIEEILAIKLAVPVVSLTVNTTSNSSALNNQLEVYKASPALFTCTADIDPSIDISITADFTWYIGSSEPVNNNTDNVVIISESINITESMYESQILVPLVQSMSVGNNVKCTVSLIHDQDKDFYIVDSEKVIVTKDIVLLEPNILVTVQPVQLTLIDFAPYNSFTLTCIVEEKQYLALQLSVHWILNENILTEEDGYLINTTILNQPAIIIQTLTYSNSSSNPGDYEYICMATLSISNKTSDQIQFTGSATVTINEPHHPYAPTDVAISVINSQRAVITWVVRRIAYDHEKYLIQYGLSEDDLSDTPQLDGNLDLSLEYQMYNLTLISLEPNRTYYYWILTENGYSTIISSTFTFKTPETSFTLEIPQVAPVEAGFQQILICLITVNSSLTPPSITWISPDGQEIKDNSSTLTILPLTVPMDDITNVQITLLFPVVMTSYAGLYTCRAVTEEGEMTTVAEYLIVKIPTPLLNVSIIPMNQYGVYEGHNVSISCDGLLSPSVDNDITITTEWFHNNQAIIQSEQISLISDGLKNVMNINTVNKTFAGIYECQMTISYKERREDIIIPVTTKTEIELEVQDLPEHSISINSIGSTTIGQSMNLTCVVTSLDPLMDTLSIKWYASTKELVSVSFKNLSEHDDGIYTLDLYISALKASNAGPYECHAASNINVLELVQETIMEKVLIVSLPPPLLTISLSPSQENHYAGSPLNMTCKTKLIPEIDVPVLATPTWFKDGLAQLPNTTRISYSQDGASVVFSSLSKAIDSGSYECLILLQAMVYPQFITPSLPVDINITIDVLDPPLKVTLLPLTTIILDIIPYNQFTLTCQVESAQEVISQKQVSWRMLQTGSDKLSTLITNNTTNITVMANELENGVLKSVLVGYFYVPGEYHFFCDGFINIVEDTGPSINREVIVSVKGPQEPLAVRNTSAKRGPTVDSVLIAWTVYEIVYTPETYTLLYGQTKDTLQWEVAHVTSGDNLRLQNASYQVLIEELEPGNHYYYKITSDNMYKTTVDSEVEEFTAGFNRSLVLLRLNGVHRCGEWIFSDAKNKITDISRVLTNVLKSQCNCSFTSDLILDSQFACRENVLSDVLFYAYIYQTTDKDSEELVNYLQEWLADTTYSLVVNGAQLQIVQKCGVNSTDETVCPMNSLNNVSSKGGLPMYQLYIIVGGSIGVTIAALCVCLVICLIWKFHSKAKQSKEENMRMREILRASSIPTLSPLQTNMGEKTDHYTSPNSFPINRYPQTPPPNYMSPRSSVLGKSQRPCTPTRERDSHIYYLNTPPRTTPNLPDHIYEHLPDTVEGNYQTPRRFFPPDVPPMPAMRMRTASRDSLADKLTMGISTSKQQIDKEEEPIEQPTCDKPVEEGCDYIEMNAVDFSSATI